MSGGIIRVEGLNELQRSLKLVSAELPVEVKAAALEGAEIVATDMRSRAPRLSGRLLGTIRAGSTLHGSYVKVGGKATPYTKPIVFGWAKHNIRANRFPYTSLDARRPAVIELFRRRLANLLRKVK